MNLHMARPRTPRRVTAPARNAVSLLLLLAGPAFAQGTPPAGSSLEAIDLFASAISPGTSAPQAAVPDARAPLLLPSPRPAQQLKALDVPRIEPLPPAPVVLAASAVTALGVGLLFGMRDADALARLSDSIHQPQAAIDEATWAQGQFAVQQQESFDRIGRAYSAISALAAGVIGALVMPHSSQGNGRDRNPPAR